MVTSAKCRQGHRKIINTTGKAQRETRKDSKVIAIIKVKITPELATVFV